MKEAKPERLFERSGLTHSLAFFHPLDGGFTSPGPLARVVRGVPSVPCVQLS
jgi:hypothetical protein